MQNLIWVLALAAIVAWSFRETQREAYDRRKMREDTAKLFLTVQEFNRVLTAFGNEHQSQFSIAVLCELVREIDSIEGMTRSTKGKGQAMQDAFDSPLYDWALATAILLLELFDTAGDAPKPILLSRTTFLILDAIREVRPLPAGLGRPSAN